ncbi:MAG: glycosyltransferase family 2 protein [Erysipelotrichaceae bacterium]|nr:glycosyltransferase family 2 protein [Erysipelotrichaceae bacterium]
MPEVSIIMPVFNKEKYLRSSLDSVLAQTFSDFELIAVNDGSTDMSQKILDEYAEKDSRIHVIVQQNQGVSAARNRGLFEAKGTWIQFLDGDDLIQNDYLSKILNTEFTESADIIFSDFSKMDETGKVTEVVRSGVCTETDQYGLAELYLNLQYQNGFFGFISNKLIRKDLIDSCNALFNEKLTLAEDLDFFLQIYPSVKKAVFSDINSFLYLQTDTNYLLRKEVDYDLQIGIQLRAAEWIDSFNLNHPIENGPEKAIGNYVYAILFEAEESGAAAERLLGQSHSADILRHVDPDQFTGLKRQILSLLKKKKIWEIQALLKVRNSVRTVYRRLKK